MSGVVRNDTGGCKQPIPENVEEKLLSMSSFNNGCGGGQR